jgi:hypothetical protein
MKKLLSMFCLILAIYSSSFATTVVRLTLDDMVKKAHEIVQGSVRSSQTRWSPDHRIILTITTIDIQETIKGQPSKTIELTTIGGTIGDLTLVVPGMPSFETGEDAVIFIENVGAVKTVVGLNQGKFSVRNGDVANRMSGLSFPDGREGGAPVRMRLEDFKRQIKDRLK